jgi:NAD(P)-dependent dehydrogenase (short-subunit alcohol dehydrogenase family)
VLICIGQDPNLSGKQTPTEGAPMGASLDLEGRVALVTGASKGIGAAIARVYAENGASVMLSSRKHDALEQTASQIKGDTAVFAAHAGDPEQAAACVAATIERFGGLDILVNNAATNPYMGRAIDIDLPRYDKTMEVNLRGPLVWTQEAWRQSLEAGGGTVINIVSVGGMTFGGPIGIYDVTKAALIHLTKHLATELGPQVRVNAIAPGLVKTDFARALWEPGANSDKWPWPLGRLGTPDDVADAALFLASDLSRWITGHVLVVDGGGMVQGSRRT